ncbi:MAG TPA: AMP-binding protein [Acetobacteraceae bacterium]|jgi:acyl-CoA synthetase (AMP-forming)/AMP-acid ligase II|nr:AMP-binding protein [Acetobacteraceae bacterium]
MTVPYATLAVTVAAAFTETAARHPASPFLHVEQQTARAYGIPSGATTYSEAASQIAHLRAAYAAAGYGPGHRVGLMLDNRPTFFFHWLALNALGTAVVPLNADLRPAELNYLAHHSDIVLGIAAAPHLRALHTASPDLATIAADESPPPAPRPACGHPPDRTTECALLYTSGTTGRPKGCVLANDYYLRAGHWYATIGGLCQLHQGDRLITPLPLTHMNAMAYSTMAMIATGGCIVQLDRFHPRTWWSAVRESQATIVHYLGVMPSMLLSATPDPKDRDHTVRFGFGAGVDRRHHAAFEQRFGFPLLEAWAMTETGAGAVVIANREPRHIGTNCFGRPEPKVEVRIIPQDGELLVRAAGPDPRAGFFSEYLMDPEAAEAAWEGGWFHTGDIVRADADGYLTFVDRKKNVIRRSGENISAVEVESVLRRHPAVAEVAVAAVADDIRGEEVLACIVPSTPVIDPAEAAIDIVRKSLQDLSYFKVPGWIAFVDTLPLTASQKVARGELKTMAQRLVQDPDCIDTRGLKRR